MPDTLAYIEPGALVTFANWSNTGGADILDAITDDLDSTWAWTGTLDARLKVRDFDTPAVPAGAIIKGVQAMFRADANNVGYSDIVLLLIYDGVGVVAQGPVTRLSIHPFFQNLTSPSVSSRPDGTPITQSDLDTKFHIEAAAFPYDGGAVQVLEAWLVVQYNQQPTVAPLFPSNGATITTTARPTLAWTFSDPDGDSQERYRVKVFSGTTAVADPETETARLVWDSGETISNATSQKVGISLDNAGYIWYVKAADAGSQGRYSAWAGGWTFTVSITPPVTPTLDAVTAIGQWITLQVMPGSGTPAADFYAFQRSYDGGTTWEDFRPSQTLAALAHPNPSLLIDPDTRRGITTHFRTRAFRYVGGDPSPPSAWSNVLSATLAGDGFSYLMRSTTEFGFQFRWPIGTEFGVTTESEEDQSVFAPAGREDFVVVSGAVRGHRGQINLLLRDDDDWRQFQELRAAREALLLKTCYGDDDGLEQWWVRFGAVLSVTRYSTSDRAEGQRRRVTVGIIPVATPN